MLRFLVSGLLYGLVRDRMRPLPFKVFVVLCIPIAVDGLTQLFGWRESNWLLRTLTGALFGFAAVWLAYPYVDERRWRDRGSRAEDRAKRGRRCRESRLLIFFSLFQFDMLPILPYTTILLSEGQSSQLRFLQHIHLGASARAQPAW